MRRVDMQFANLELVGSDLHSRTRMPWGFSLELHKSDLQICRAYFQCRNLWSGRSAGIPAAPMWASRHYHAASWRIDR